MGTAYDIAHKARISARCGSVQLEGRSRAREISIAGAVVLCWCHKIWTVRWDVRCIHDKNLVRSLNNTAPASQKLN